MLTNVPIHGLVGDHIARCQELFACVVLPIRIRHIVLPHIIREGRIAINTVNVARASTFFK